MFFKNISEIISEREFGALPDLRNRREGGFPAAGDDAQAVYAHQDAGRGMGRRRGRIATQPEFLDQIRSATRHSQRALHSFWDIGERPVGGRVKGKGPKLGTRGLHSEGGGGRGLTAWDAVC